MSEASFRERHVRHWDRIAEEAPNDNLWSGTYHRRLRQIYAGLIPAGQRVIEVGCGAGDLLASVQPTVGVGVDFSPKMIAEAERRHPHLRFLCADAHAFALDQLFDFVICSDLVDDVWDVERLFKRLRGLLAPGGRLIINLYNRGWELPLKAASRLGLSRTSLEQSWLNPEDVRNLLTLADCETVRTWPEFLCPAPIPVIEPLFNRVLAKSWPFSLAALSHFVVARATSRTAPDAVEEKSVSIVIPARNESGHIESVFERLPEFGSRMEIIFVEGHSTDDTYDVIEAAIARHPERQCQLHRQTGKGKGDAVRLGFAKSTGDVLMILDADLTVAPEDLPRFYAALVTGKGEFVNGVRLVYPREDRAMRFFNLLANKFFGWLFSWLIGQRVKDTLCGTKVLSRSDYELIVANRGYFGDFDPFGDFELLFGAARFSRKIVEMPVRYRERVYGETNIRRWHDGVLLLRMAFIAARRLKWT
jgi:SAM-dependent methyltransferase